MALFPRFTIYRILIVATPPDGPSVVGPSGCCGRRHPVPADGAAGQRQDEATPGGRRKPSGGGWCDAACQDPASDIAGDSRW